MTERASDLLGALSDRLTADMGDTGASTADVVREAVPELVMAQPEGFTEMPIRSSAQFLPAKPPGATPRRESRSSPSCRRWPSSGGP